MNRRLLFGLVIMFALPVILYNRPAIGQGPLTPTPFQSLQEQAGFSSPVLDDLQRKGIHWFSENIAFTAYGHDYRLLSFAPVSVPAGDGNKLDSGTVMLFQLDRHEGRLLWQKDVDGERTILNAQNAETAFWPAPGDWEKNGQTAFGVFYVHDSTCPVNPLDMYVLSADGAVTSRFKNLIPLDHIVTSIEPQNSGALLVTALDERGKSMDQCVTPHMIRYFEIAGARLTDVSTQHRAAYMNQLGEDLYITTTWKSLPQLSDDGNAQWYAARLMDMLLIYDALGEREAGYGFVQSLATEALKTGRIKPNTYLDRTFFPP